MFPSIFKLWIIMYNWTRSLLDGCYLHWCRIMLILISFSLWKKRCVFPDRSQFTNKWVYFCSDTRWFSWHQEFGEVIMFQVLYPNMFKSYWTESVLIFGCFQICDVVVVSRLLNATLAMPEIQSTTSSKGIRFLFFQGISESNV